MRIAHTIPAAACIARLCLAQNSELDSLYRIWLDTSGADTSRLNAALRFIPDLAGHFPDSAMALATQGATFAERTGYRGHQGRMLIRQGEILYRRSDLAGSALLYQKAYDLLEPTEFKESAIVALNGEAQCQTHMGNDARAIQLCYSALRIAREIGNVSREARIYNTLGNIFIGTADYDKAIDSHTHALVIRDSIGDENAAAISRLNLGNAYYYMKRYHEALRYEQEAYDVIRHSSDPISVARTLQAIGSSLVEVGKSDSASSCVQRAYVICQQRSDRLGMYLAELFYAKLAVKQGAWADGRRHAHTAYDLATEIGDVESIRDASELLSDLYKRSGQFRLALDMYEVHVRMRDSLRSESQRRAMLNQEYEFEYQRKMERDSTEDAVRLIRADNERVTESLRADRNRNRAWGIGLGALILASSGTLFYRSDRRRRQARADQRAAELEIKALRAQMNPHFLFNALNSINDHIQESETEVASDFLTRFSRLMRQVLEMSRLNEVPLKRELDVLRSYIDLERMRLKDKFDVTVEVGPEVDLEAMAVPPMILQPFVENAIWHGLSRKEGQGILRIAISQRDGALVVAIEDDGIGRVPQDQSQSQPEGKTSLGTTITRDRLDLLAKQRGAPAGFTFVPVAQGTRVELVLPQAA